MPPFSLGLWELFVASQCLLASLLLLASRRRDGASSTALGLLLGLLGVHLGVEGAQGAGWLEPGIYPVDLFGFLYGPLFLLFVRALAFRQVDLRSWQAFHLAPFTLALASLAWGSLSPEVYAIAVWISLGTYLTLALRTLRTYRGIIESTRSNVDRISLGWLRFSIYGLVAIYVLDIASLLADQGAEVPGVPVLPWLLFAVLLAYVYGFVVAALTNPRVFEGVSEREQELAEAARGRRSSRPTPADAAELEGLERRMMAEGLHLEPQITLSQLSGRLGCPVRRLSELVNDVRGQNFSDWINGWRVEEAKRLLASQERADDSILDILLDAGFNSKSTFNAVFKKKTGMTPSEHRRHESL